MSLRRRVHEILDQTAEGDRIGRLVSAGLIALIAANVAAVVIEFGTRGSMLPIGLGCMLWSWSRS